MNTAASSFSAINALPLVITAIFFFLIIDFVRRGLLKEKYSVLWIAFIIVAAILSIWQELLTKVALILGVSYPPSLLFLVAIIMILLLLLHFSVVISILTEKCKTLAQETAMIKEELANIKKTLGKETDE
ncbi:MAG: DUF2304 domain-containing protein [Deltaproteobacteria bacterium]|nr:DUF2304 domain-containing protein [Deltaproteobacteria bacterium]